MKRTTHSLDWHVDSDTNNIFIVDNVGSRIPPNCFVPLTEIDLMEMLEEVGYTMVTGNVVGGVT